MKVTQRLKDDLPQETTHLTLLGHRNILIGSLPPNLIFLETNIVMEYPSSLTSLIISSRKSTAKLSFEDIIEEGYSFLERKMVNSLPISLTYLKVFDSINYYSIPPNLIELDAVIWEDKLDLPSTLKHLSLHCSAYNCEPRINIPPQLLSLQISTSKIKFNLNDLPQSLTFLELSYESKIDFQALSLPSLTHLSLSSSKVDLYKLPKTLLSLILTDFNKPVTILPPSLTSLTFNAPFNSLLTLPSSLQLLDLGNCFNHPLPVLPSSLLTLCLGNAFNQSIDNLPTTLRHLSIQVSPVFDYSKLNFLSTLTLIPHKNTRPISFPSGVHIYDDGFEFEGEYLHKIAPFIPFVTSKGITYRPLITVSL